MRIELLGAAGTVTGSKTLLESNGIHILIDCGLFQGLKPLRELNWNPLPVLSSSIDYVLLTHGHLDHCGWLPKLINEGFKGTIYCTYPTKEITKLVLLDSAKIQEEEANKANEEHYSNHEIAKPLYTILQAEKVFPLLKVVSPNEVIDLKAGISVLYTTAGHIIGACSITVTLENKTLVFSGDIGRDNDVLMFPPTKPKKGNYIFLESTYGNKLHPDNDVLSELETSINEGVLKGGTVIIPGFAVERAQSIMYLLWQLKKEKRIPDIPYILDTPMGIDVLEIFSENTKWHKLSPDDSAEMSKMFTLISNYKETMEMVYDKHPKVIIAASGMVTGGRVLGYLKHYISMPQTTLLIIGYQAEGTRGRKLLEGVKNIKIHGKYYSVKASIIEIQGLSAHGDQKDLINWLSELDEKPEKIFLVHGENQPVNALKIKIKEHYGLDCIIPFIGQVFEI